MKNFLARVLKEVKRFFWNVGVLMTIIVGIIVAIPLIAIVGVVGLCVAVVGGIVGSAYFGWWFICFALADRIWGMGTETRDEKKLVWGVEMSIEDIILVSSGLALILTIFFFPIGIIAFIVMHAWATPEKDIRRLRARWRLLLLNRHKRQKKKQELAE